MAKIYEGNVSIFKNSKDKIVVMTLMVLSMLRMLKHSLQR